MRTKPHPPHTLILSLSAGVVALLLAGLPLTARADELTPEPTAAGPAAAEPTAAGPAAAEPATAESAAAEPATAEPAAPELASVEVPVVTSGPLPAGTVGVPYDYQLTSNVSPVSFSVEGLPDGLQADSLSGLISGTPEADGEFAVRLEALGSDGGDSTQVRYDTLVIAPAPVTVPVITSPSLPAGMVGVGYGFQLTSNVSPVTFSVEGLPAGLTADAQSGLISGTPTVDGEFAVRLEALGSGGGDSTQVRYDTLVIAAAPVTVPAITSPPLPGGAVGVGYSFQLTSNVSPVTFSVEGLPAGLTADAQSGLISGVPTVEGEFAVRLEAIGSGGGDTTQVRYDTLVIASSPGDLPVITSETPPDGVVGAAYAFVVQASAPAATFSAVGLTPGLTLDGTTGLISGTPTTAGAFTVALTATAAGLSSEPAVYTLTVHPQVTPPSSPPVFTSTPPAAATIGTAFSFIPTVTSSTAVSFTHIGNVPGLSFDPATGRLAGTPTTAGSYDLTIIATNGAATPASVTFTLTVSPAATTVPPAEVPPSAPAAENPAAAPLPSADQAASIAAAERIARERSGLSSSLAETGRDGGASITEGVWGLLILASGAGFMVLRRRLGSRA